jgi:trigger factor
LTLALTYAMVPDLMQVTVQRISPVIMELQVQVPASTVKAEIDKAYTDLAKKAHIKGFRPGKAPRQVLTQMFSGKISADVANTLVQDTLPKALTEKSVAPIATPEVVEAGSVAASEDFSYKARVEVQPDVETVNYEALELSRPSTEVTDANIDEQLDALRQRKAEIKPLETTRPAQKGDVLTIDFTLVVDGAEVKDGAGNGVQLELGSGQVLPELDEGLVGKKTGDEAAINATFPEAHPRPDFRNKPATFQVKVTDVKERVLPTLDDAFAKDLGAGFDTLEALKADIRKQLEKALKERAEISLAEQIVAKLNELNPLDVPPSLVEQQRRIMEQEFAMQARRFNARFTREQAQNLVGQMQVDAEKKVRAGLLMAAIAKKLEMKVTEEDIEKAYGELAEETGKNVAKVKAEYRDPQKRQLLIGMILEDKILDLIESKAKVTDLPAEAAATK